MTRWFPASVSPKFSKCYIFIGGMNLMSYKAKSYRKFIATGTTAAIVASAIAPAASAAEQHPFTDVNSNYDEAVSYLYNNEITSGLTETTFGTTASLTRGDAAVIIARALELDTDNAPDAGFEDVNSRVAGAVNALVDAEIISGYSDTEFKPAEQLSRGAMAKILVNAYELSDYAVDTEFTDLTATFKEYIEALYGAGITGGKTETTYGTNLDITRGEFAVLLHRSTQIVDPAPEPVELEVSSVSAITKTKVEVVFNEELDTVNADNFSVEGATVNTATLGEDSKTVTLDVSGLDFGTEYNLEVTGLTLNGNTVPSETVSFVTPEVTSQYELRLTTNVEDNTVTANGADNTVVTAELIDRVTGEVDKDADNIVLAFSTTFGNLANDRVTVQDGKATVLFTSEFRQKTTVAKVDAQIIETTSDYDALIGEVVGTTNIVLEPATTGDVTAEPVLVGGESNLADRLTLYFNEDVSVSDFDDEGSYVTVNDSDNVVRGYKAVDGNTKAIEVILEKDTPLTDNKKVDVTAKVRKGTEASTSFIVTDARKPEPTSAVAEDLKTVKVVFSEPIAEATKVLIDGGLVGIDDVTYGEFNPTTGEDNRNVLTIKTTDYLKAGTHSVQLSAVKDYAGLSDDKNISSTQVLDFTVEANDKKPAATVKVESPEQVRVSFDTIIAEETAGVQDSLVLQKKNDDGGWDNVDKADQDFVVSQPDTDKSEYVVEFTNDWTTVYDTQSTKLNYYNDEYRFVINEKALTNPANGKTNDKITLDLNYSGSALNSNDTVSPKITGIELYSTKGESDLFEVTMDEPVKLPGEDVEDTPSQLQGDSIPNPIIEFQGVDPKGNPVTIEGEVKQYSSLDGNDTQFLVQVKEGKQDLQVLVDEEGYGEDWTLIVRSISDDVGNTAATLTEDFTVEASPNAVDNFKVYDLDSTPEVEGLDIVQSVTNADGVDVADEIHITFTDGVKYTGTNENAINVSNYLLDGESLPKGSSISVENGIGTTEDGYEKVIITLPNNTLDSSENSALLISEYLVSHDGIKLEGPYEFDLSKATILE
jgi:methionine-rich copper-binding protein CopC